MNYLVTVLYIVAFAMFILGLSGLTGPKTAVRGNYIAAVGMGIAVVATLITVRDTARSTGSSSSRGLALGVVLGVPPAKKTKMTAMPQLVALFNGVGGGTVALIAWAEFIETDGFAHYRGDAVGGRWSSGRCSPRSSVRCRSGARWWRSSSCRNRSRRTSRSVSSPPPSSFRPPTWCCCSARSPRRSTSALNAGVGSPSWLIIAVLVLAGVMGLFVVLPDRRRRHARGHLAAQRVDGFVRCRSGFGVEQHRR